MSCVSYFECEMLPKFCHQLRDIRHLSSSLVRGTFSKSQGRQVHGRSNVNTYSKGQRDQMIGQRGRGLVTSELRHQTAGRNDNNAKRQMMGDEIKMSWFKGYTDRKDIDVEMIPLKHTAGTCVFCFSGTRRESCVQCIQSAYGVRTECIRSAYGVHTECIRSAYRVRTECIRSAYGVHTQVSHDCGNKCSLFSWHQ